MIKQPNVIPIPTPEILIKTDPNGRLNIVSNRHVKYHNTKKTKTKKHPMINKIKVILVLVYFQCDFDALHNNLK